MRLEPREHLVEHRAAGVDVGAGVGAVVGDDLRREVGDGADQRPAGRGRCGADGPGQAEVGDLDVAVGGDEDVLGLDVAVDDLGRVGGRQRDEHLLEQLERAVGRHRRFLAHEVAQRAAGDVLHDEIGDVAVAALVEDRDHVAVVELGGRLGLADETVGELLVVAEPVVHDLDRDLAVEPAVDSKEHAGHAAACNAVADQVAVVEDASDQGIIARHCHATLPRHLDPPTRPLILETLPHQERDGGRVTVDS